MQHPFGALTRNFRLIRLRKFGGQQPAGPAGDGDSRVVSAKCLVSLNGHLLRPGGASPPCFSSAQCRRHKTYNNALKNSFSPNYPTLEPSPQRSLGHSSFSQNTAKFFYCFSHQNFEICTPGIISNLSKPVKMDGWMYG